MQSLSQWVPLMLAKTWLDVSIYSSVILVTGVAAVLMAAPSDPAFGVAAVFPPWWSADDVRKAVDPIGAAASSGRTPNIVTVYGYGAGDLQLQLRQAGAWLILDPRVLACG
jgi:hypothetical protein